MTWSRRELMRSLLAAGALGVWGRRGQAALGWDVELLELDVGLPSNAAALQVLAQEVSGHTSVRAASQGRAIKATDPELFLQPLAFLAGDRAFPALSEPERASLRSWISAGGVLLLDDRSGSEGSPFWRSVEREVDFLAPGRPMEPLGPDHAVYRSYFLLPQGGGAGRRPIRPYILGLTLGDTSPVLGSRNDLLGAAEAGPLSWGEGRSWRGDAMAMAVNLVLYAITANYKTDAVHVETLLQRLRVERGVFR